MIVKRIEEHQAMVNNLLYDVELMAEVKAVISLVVERFQSAKNFCSAVMEEAQLMLSIYLQNSRDDSISIVNL